MPDAELELDAAPRDPTQMLDAFLVAAVRPPLRRLGPPAGRVVGLFVGLVAATTSLAYVGAHAADAHTPAQLAVGVLGVVVVAAAPLPRALGRRRADEAPEAGLLAGGHGCDGINNIVACRRPPTFQIN